MSQKNQAMMSDVVEAAQKILQELLPKAKGVVVLVDCGEHQYVAGATSTADENRDDFKQLIAFAPSHVMHWAQTMLEKMTGKADSSGAN